MSAIRLLISYGANQIHPRANKKIYIQDKSHLDGESATIAIKIGRMKQREAFIDSLPDVVCYDGVKGLQDAFKRWLADQKTHAKNKSIF